VCVQVFTFLISSQLVIFMRAESINTDSSDPFAGYGDDEEWKKHCKPIDQEVRTLISSISCLLKEFKKNLNFSLKLFSAKLQRIVV